MTTLSQTRGFEIPGAIHIEVAPGGLLRAMISTPTAQAELYLQGAHLATWTPSGQKPVLFLSPKSLFTPGKAIRGGVPIIFPWFGDRGDGKPGPAHGFARTSEWELENTKLHNDGSVEIALTLKSNTATSDLFPAPFRLRFCARIGSRLQMELETRNDSVQPLTYEAALHTYLAVGDVQQIAISGLEGSTYIDKTDGSKRKLQGAGPIRITKEMDQVHLGTTAACIVHDSVWNRRIVVEKSGSQSTVLWNPWVKKTQSMSDMAADSWMQMACIETANAADDAVHLAPGASHTLQAMIHVE